MLTSELSLKVLFVAYEKRKYKDVIKYADDAVCQLTVKQGNQKFNKLT